MEWRNRIMRYKRKYLEEIDVVQWTGDNLEEIKEFLGSNLICMNNNGDIWYKHAQEMENFGIAKTKEYIYKNENYYNTIDESTLLKNWQQA